MKSYSFLCVCMCVYVVFYASLVLWYLLTQILSILPPQSGVQERELLRSHLQTVLE